MNAKRVLVVDDEEQLLRAFARMAPDDLRIVAVTTPAAARRAAERESFDCAVIDYRLADGASGIDLVRELRKLQPALKLVVCSAYATAEVAVAAMKAGADDVRPKPLTASAVVRWLEVGNWEEGDVQTTPTLERMQWEYAHRVVRDCDGNISEAARRLDVQRLTLRRYLAKREPER